MATLPGWDALQSGKSRMQTDLSNAIAVAMATVSLGLCLHWLGECFDVLRAGVARSKITMDFLTYRCGVQDLAHPYGTCGSGEAVGGFVYPPPSLIYFKGLSLLPLGPAFVVHGLVLVTCFGATVLMLGRSAAVGRKARFVAGVASLAIAPVGTSLVAGQANPVVLACCVAGVWFSTTGRHSRAGIAVALGFWFKLYPFIVPALFFPQRRRPALAMTVLATVAIASVSLLWASPGLFRSYFLDLLPHVQGYTMPGVAHSLAGIVAHAVGGGGAPAIHFVPVPGAIGLASKALLVAGIVAAMAHQHLTQDQRPMESLGVLLSGALVAAPNAWGYHYVLVVPALFMALAATIDRPSWRTPIVIAGWLALCVPDWSDLPRFVAENPGLNVALRGRYALVALILAILACIPDNRSRSASTSPA